MTPTQKADERMANGLHKKFFGDERADAWLNLARHVRRLNAKSFERGLREGLSQQRKITKQTQ